ncbi:MAG: Crp/Fnr family transcriptional regulator [Deltaproteobacteria bacterium]|nr:Crp/Fnr family transcriptional regulator [Deltaproteobacteria bacterium]
MDTLEFLQSTQLFSDIPAEQLGILSRSAREKKYAAGQFIISESDEVQSFFIVKKGMVKLFKTSFDGKEQTIYLFRPGEMFCLCSTLNASVYPADAMALEESTLLVLPGDVLEVEARQNPRILFNMLSVLCHRLKDTLTLVESLSLKEIPQRFASFLLMSTRQSDGKGGDIVELPVTQRELAKMLGATPETLNRVMKKMVEEGMISMQGRFIKTLNRKALEELAGDGLE